MSNAPASQFVEMEVYHALLESHRQRAVGPDGRHAQRHRQRQAAGSEDLTLVMNKLRQESITNELLDLIGGHDRSLEG